MGDQVLAAHPAERVFELHELDEDVMLGIQPGRGHGSLEIERKPFLNAAHTRALRQVQEQNQVQDQRRRQNRIAAQKIDLDLHRIAQPSENVDIIPAFFGVAARRIVIDPHGVIEILIQFADKAWAEECDSGR